MTTEKRPRPRTVRAQLRELIARLEELNLHAPRRADEDFDPPDQTSPDAK